MMISTDSQTKIQEHLELLKKQIKGEVHTDNSYRIIYATDASPYKEKPIAVVCPKDKNDIQRIIHFAQKHKIPVTPRTAGTSLAGQVVSKGIIVDVSKYMTQIIQLDTTKKTVTVQPGVVLDELNQEMAQHDLFFGPETSTSNRCMMGGMVANNSCGAHSMIYGSTRDHTLEVNTLLSDGSEVVFKDLTPYEYEQKLKGDRLENKIYQKIHKLLSNKENQKEIRDQYPDPRIHRRNTGYALDLLLQQEAFNTSGKPINLSTLIAGSEGTLAFITEIKLQLIPIPPKHKGLLCVHFDDLHQTFLANLIALKHLPGSVELIDEAIISSTESNILQKKNRFFIKGSPKAILIIEWARDTFEEIQDLAAKTEEAFRKEGHGYYFPLVTGTDINKVWNLRKAGLGLLSNIPGDKKPVALVEDTAVHPSVLPEYIKEFDTILKTHQLNCVYYAHIGSGELHLRPILNLKDKNDVQLFHKIGKQVALLVKKYNGSLSGEHGDGRLRAEFIPFVIGKRNYQLCKEIKNSFDPLYIFNPNKIIDPPSIIEKLRYENASQTQEINTYFDFSKTRGIQRAVEQCNGSGDCRKSALIGGTMCPSYMATKDEKNTTRARANLLREFIVDSKNGKLATNKEMYDILDLCLQCKACKSECPSNVDMTKIKAEFLQHYYDKYGISLRTRLIANLQNVHQLASLSPFLYNTLLKIKPITYLMKKALNIASERELPKLNPSTLRQWANKNLKNWNKPSNPYKVYLFADEFTNYNEVELGITTIKLLTQLGYQVIIPKHKESGRTYLSKGFLKKAKRIAIQNVQLLKDKITSETPLVGIEPSCILTFRDEYPELVDKKNLKDAKKIAANTFSIEEFIDKEIQEKHIVKEQFNAQKRIMKLHGHCFQKSLASTAPILRMLNFPENHSASEIPSGCCGMAGSFGYEKEHYQLSKDIAHLVLIPEIKKLNNPIDVVASGTSCRQQIKDFAQTKALHPVEILYQSLK